MEHSVKQKALEEGAEVEEIELYQGRVFSLRHETLHFKDHPSYEWDLIIHPGAVAIIPVQNNGNLLLIKQWRRPIKKIIYEIPAGTLDEGEAPLPCAQRELQEEVDHKAGSMIPFGGFYSTPGFCTEYVHLFIAKDLTPSSLDGDAHEAIDVEEIPLEKALEMVDSGMIDDLKTITGILKYKRWLDA